MLRIGLFYTVLYKTGNCLLRVSDCKMVQCCVIGCKNRQNQGPCDVTFHRFPTNEHLAKVWIEACGRYDWKPTKNTRMCSKHFKNDYLAKHGNRTFLKIDAVPTKHTCINKNFTEPNSSKSTESSTEHVVTPKDENDLSASTPTKRKIEIETPREKIIRKISLDRLKKLRAVRQTNRRLLKRNEELKNIIMELKSKSLL